MRLASIVFSDGGAAAVVRDGRAARIDGYRDVGELFAAGTNGIEAARAAESQGVWSDFAASAVEAPVRNPGAVFCVGLNYREHILEMGRELPVHPTLFAKLPRALTGPSEPVELPSASPEVDYEGELVVVVGRAGRDIPEDQAHEHIGGYTLMNDVSMRDWQYRTLQWFAGKNFERATPFGPYVVTPDMVDLDAAEIVVTVNGELRQQSSLSDLLFSPAQLIADISRITTLQPGDLIATGTPGGVGHALKPPRHLCDGDVVEVAVDGVGILSTRFAAAGQ
jgi:acylpyruvate hydrolase